MFAISSETARRMAAGHGLGLTSIGVTVGKKIKILKHCVECVCTFAAVDIYRLGRWPSQLSLQRRAAAWQGGRTAGVRHGQRPARAELEVRRAERIRSLYNVEFENSFLFSFYS